MSNSELMFFVFRKTWTVNNPFLNKEIVEIGVVESTDIYAARDLIIRRSSVAAISSGITVEICPIYFDPTSVWEAKYSSDDVWNKETKLVIKALDRK